MRFTSDKVDTSKEQLMARAKFRKAVLELGHNSILGGHLGSGKTFNKIIESTW